MLDNLPSASRRTPLATGRALVAALLLHGAIGAAIYLSGAVGGEDSSPVRPGAPLATEPGEPAVAPIRPATGGAPTARDTTRMQAGDAASSAAGELALAGEQDGLALTRIAAGMLIEAPDTMRLGESYEVRLALPPSPLARPARAATSDTAGTRRARDGISPVRQAVLVGENAVVEPRTRALQLADSAAPTIWRWMVTPTEPGRSRLAAELSVVHYRAGKERIASLRGLQKDVHVEASWAQQISRFLATHWFWVLVFTMLSTTAWLRARFDG